MKLTYYRAAHVSGNTAKDLRSRTKKDCTAVRGLHGADNYDDVRKVTIEYKDGFDLLTQCLTTFDFENQVVETALQASNVKAIPEETPTATELPESEETEVEASAVEG